MDIATKCQTHNTQRLIDVNALKEAWKDVAVDGATLSYIYGLFKSVDDAPTIDAVRHGEWIDNVNNDGISEGYYTCNQCRTISGEQSNYCPNCGAKMDRERDE